MAPPTRFTLEDFVTESNRIEGLDPASLKELDAHNTLLSKHGIEVYDLRVFVGSVARARLRECVGDDVRVGLFTPPPGGPKLVDDLRLLLREINERRLTPYEAHRQYETLHPFMDGNGRSGRALWLWMQGGIAFAPLGFLHTWYYQSLAAR